MPTYLAKAGRDASFLLRIFSFLVSLLFCFMNGECFAARHGIPPQGFVFLAFLLLQACVFILSGIRDRQLRMGLLLSDAIGITSSALLYYDFV